MLNVEELRQEYVKDKERVVFIYNRSQLAVDSDKYLLQYYKTIFGNTEYREDTIKRAGRSLRHRFPDRFIRGAEKKNLDEDLTQLNIEVFAGG